VPGWIPPISDPTYAGSTMPVFMRSQKGYAVQLVYWTRAAHGNKRIRFEMDGTIGSTYRVTTHTVPVQLSPGRWGYLDIRQNAPLSLTAPRAFQDPDSSLWSQYTYTILGPNPPLHSFTVATLLRVARSLTCLHVPTGQTASRCVST
jgi:hypothetical protein